MINPINHTRTPERRGAVPGGAVRRGRRCLRASAAPWPRRLVVVHGFGRRGCIRRPSRVCLACARGDRVFSMDPSIPGLVAAILDRLAPRRTRYLITVLNPEHQGRGVRSAELDGAPVEPHAIPLVDDGQTHEGRIVLGKAHSAGGATRIGQRSRARPPRDFLAPQVLSGFRQSLPRGAPRGIGLRGPRAACREVGLRSCTLAPAATIG